MYKALYSFQTKDENALNFKENDHFTVIDRTRDNHWWLVQNGKGQVGFVPANYLQHDEASHADVIKSIDRAIEAIYKSAPLGNAQNLTQLQRNNLQKLQRHRESVIEENRRERAQDVQLRPKRQAPVSPTSPSTPSAGNRNSKRSEPPPPPVRRSVLSSATVTLNSPTSPNADTNAGTINHFSSSLISGDSINAQTNSPAMPITTQKSDTYSVNEQAQSSISTPKSTTSSSTNSSQNSPSTSLLRLARKKAKESSSENSPKSESNGNKVHQVEQVYSFSRDTSGVTQNYVKDMTDRKHKDNVSDKKEIEERKEKEKMGESEEMAVSEYSINSDKKLSETWTVVDKVNTTKAISNETVSLCKQCHNALPKNTSSNMTMQYSSGSSPERIRKRSVNNDIGKTLVEQMRSTTQLSYGQSQEAVDIMLRCLKNEIPEIGSVMDSVLQSLHKERSNESKIDLTTQDAQRLQEIFDELAKCKDDSQQRSWFLHEDEHIITGHLEELISLLDGAQSDLCKVIIKKENYTAINNLVSYYQMEHRMSLRMLLLQVFGSLCALDAAFISELLNSGLPIELARDIQNDTNDVQKLSYSFLVLTMLFSMGEPVPLHYYTHLNDDFLGFLLDMCENPLVDDSKEQILDLVVNLILAFNLHFELPSENRIMKVFAERKTSKFFTERLMLLVNKGDDPVRMFEHEPRPPHSLLKFLTDLYSSRITATVLYTNDARVLIDIIVGQLSDLEPSNQIRTDYLSLMELILKNTDYAEHCHKKDELQLCFKRIFHEEEEHTRAIDKDIVKQIWNANPDIFPAEL